MHPSVHARANPEKPAIVMAASGETISYGELDRRSNQVAQLLRSPLYLAALALVALHRDPGEPADRLSNVLIGKPPDSIGGNDTDQRW